ncbi:MAG: tetratricopeptide repeat protein, partial [Verrucomicrobiota bacterium]
VFWPYTLVYDYYDWSVPSLSILWFIRFTLLAFGFAISVIGVFQRKIWSLVLFGFYLWLAPYSSVIPVIDPAFEHRMYLPLLALVILISTSIWKGISVLQKRLPSYQRAFFVLSILLTISVASGLAIRTYQRNQDYRSEIEIWTTTAKARPGNARAYHNLAESFLENGELRRGLIEYEKALELGLRDPVQPAGHFNLANHYFTFKRFVKAEEHFSKAISLKPDYGKAYANRAVLRIQNGQFDSAAEDLSVAITLIPDNPILHVQLALLHKRSGNFVEAKNSVNAALKLGHGVPDELIREIEGQLNYEKP